MKFKDFIYFYPEKPVLVHRDQELVEKLSEDSDFVAEPKYNGSRCIVVVINGKVELWNRHNKPMRNVVKTDNGYKELIEEIKSKVPDTGHYQFEGEFRHNKCTGLQYKLVLWDCLIYNDEYLNKLTYDERRELVLKHFSVDKAANYAIGDKIISLKEWADYNKNRVTVIEQFKTDFRKVFNEYVSGKRMLAHEDEFEGLVMKNRKGKLALGRKTNPDSRWMFKIRIETGRHKF